MTNLLFLERPKNVLTFKVSCRARAVYEELPDPVEPATEDEGRLERKNRNVPAPLGESASFPELYDGLMR